MSVHSAIIRTNQRLRRLREITERLPHHLSDFERFEMSQALDDLTAAIGDLETASTAAVNEIASLLAGSDTAALPALTARVATVSANLNAAVASAAPVPPARPPAEPT